MALQDYFPPQRSKVADALGQNLPDYSFLGPDEVPAWSDPANIGKLCSRCRSSGLEDFIWDNRRQLYPSSTAVSDGFFNHTVGHRKPSPSSTVKSDGVLYQHPRSRPLSSTGSDRAKDLRASTSRESSPRAALPSPARSFRREDDYDDYRYGNLSEPRRREEISTIRRDDDYDDYVGDDPLISRRQEDTVVVRRYVVSREAEHDDYRDDDSPRYREQEVVKIIHREESDDGYNDGDSIRDGEPEDVEIVRREVIYDGNNGYESPRDGGRERIIIIRREAADHQEYSSDDSHEYRRKEGVEVNRQEEIRREAEQDDYNSNRSYQYRREANIDISTRERYDHNISDDLPRYRRREEGDYDTRERHYEREAESLPRVLSRERYDDRRTDSILIDRSRDCDRSLSSRSRVIRRISRSNTGSSSGSMVYLRKKVPRSRSRSHDRRCTSSGDRKTNRLLSEMRTNNALSIGRELDSWSQPNEEDHEEETPAVESYYDRYFTIHSDFDAKELGLLPPSKSGRDRGRMQGYQNTIWGEEDGPTMAEIRKAAYEGCHLCTLILSTWLVRRSNLSRGIEDRGWRATLGARSYENRRIFLALRNGYLFGFALKPRKSYEARFGFGFSLLETAQPPQRPISTTIANIEEQRARVVSAESVARGWLYKCLTTHGLTCSPPQSPLLPSRVLDILGDPSGQRVFLLQTNGKRAPYATISYCWGQCNLLTTTTATLAERYRGILLDSMPRTFQSAIQVARFLELRYLWIDALCIIQDSVDDCQKELGLMAEIYTNSTITIAAIGAKNADSGFTINRNKLAMIDCPWEPTVSISAHLEGQELELEQGTIHERGWCFQELQLSPRLLSCGGKELYYTCRRGTFREGKPDELFLAEGEQRIERPFDDPPRNLKDAFGRWLKQVNAYSSLNLTFSQDRLSAISGVAAHFARLFSSSGHPLPPTDYLAGLWRYDLIGGLQWMGSRFGNPTPLSSKYIAPSWSWAATLGSVQFFTGPLRRNYREEAPKQHILCKILEAWTTPQSTLAPFGAVQSGKLVLFAPAKPLTQDAYDKSLREELDGQARELYPRTRSRDRYSDMDVEQGYPADPPDQEEGQGRDGLRRRLTSDSQSSYRQISREGSVGSSRSRHVSITRNLMSVDEYQEITRPARRRNRYRSRSWSGSSDSTDSSFRVSWDTLGVHDIDCVCLLLTNYWGLVLSPVRKPGASGTYQRVGWFECDESEKFPGFGRDSRLRMFDWELKVVTII